MYVHGLDADVGVAFCKETQFLCLQIRSICFNKFIWEFCFAKSYSVVTSETFVSLTFFVTSVFINERPHHAAADTACVCRRNRDLHRTSFSSLYIRVIVCDDVYR
jgi:hypothetical protein